MTFVCLLVLKPDGLQVMSTNIGDKVNSERITALIKKMFSLLNKENASTDEALVVAEEIMLSAIERLAKENNMTFEEVQERMYGQPSKQQPKKQSVIDGLEIGAGRGWVGNAKALSENN